MTLIRLNNAHLVLPDRVMHGGVVVDDGVIQDLERHVAYAEDCEEDYVLPGIVDLHTDNLERQVLPRANARWPSRAAFLAHDSHCAAAGVTTVFDALRIGGVHGEDSAPTICAAVSDLTDLAQADALKAQHFVHLRCELSDPEMNKLLKDFIQHPLLRLVSLMDHTPGQGQFSDLDVFRRTRRARGQSDAEIGDLLARLLANYASFHAPNRALVLALANEVGVVVASHDDALEEDVLRGHSEGIAVSEFPVSLAAAQAARACGMSIIAGAPNIVRGGSHSGNVCAMNLTEHGLVDVLASDYMPSALVDAAFRCVAAGVVTLPDAVRVVTSAPAAVVGLADRGAILPGLRGDLVQVRLVAGTPVIRKVWRAGVRIA